MASTVSFGQGIPGQPGSQVTRKDIAPYRHVPAAMVHDFHSAVDHVVNTWGGKHAFVGFRKLRQIRGRFAESLGHVPVPFACHSVARCAGFDVLVFPILGSLCVHVSRLDAAIETPLHIVRMGIPLILPRLYPLTAGACSKLLTRVSDAKLRTMKKEECPKG